MGGSSVSLALPSLGKSVRIKRAIIKEECLDLTFSDGTQGALALFWLRDHARDSDSLNPETWQRRVDTFRLDEDLRADEVVIEGDGKSLAIRWANQHNAPNSLSQYPTDFLYDNVAEVKPSPLKLWNAATIANELPLFHHDEIHDDAGLRRMMDQLEIYGLVQFHGVPTNLEATKALVNRIGYIRETIFGGLWDFSANKKHSDTAYSNEEIGLHTDGTYSNDPPGLQFLHCLAFDGEGAHNIFADGFYLAEQLRKHDPKSFEILTSVKILGRYLDKKNNINLEARHPLISLDDQGNVIQICFNNYDRGPFTLAPSRMKDFYRALKAFYSLTEQAENRYRYQMRPGNAVLFDNWRLLHAREAFTGFRHIGGAYVNREDFLSRLQYLRGQFDKL